MRGERSTRPCVISALMGSSPHARGTLSGTELAPVPDRFIPACAGNARSVPAAEPACTVHPRMRGERRWAKLPMITSPGSSPHARGTPRAANLARAHVRFIPACAGNARHPASIRSWTTVHPRMRGERGSVCCTALMFSGSSPHARGTHAKRAEPWALRRFIPACAGNASAEAEAGSCTSVHPRMRGERGSIVL